MIEEIHRCNKCQCEQYAPKGSEVWCGCRPRVKLKMEKIIIKTELSRIMKKEMQLNLGYFK